MGKRITITCPLCNDAVEKLLYRFHIEGERNVIERIKEEHPAWAEDDGICGRCIDYYHTEIVMQQRLLPEIGPYFPVRSADDFVVLPTGLRLDADARYAGKGVTICFIDSGFCAHPDLTAHSNRIKKLFNINYPERGMEYFLQTRPANWHGTMTSVVCAGDGFLSNGLYKGIASSAELVLIGVQDEQGRISREGIVKALRWVLEHHREYAIRILNMSLGDDEALSYHDSEIDRLAEELIAEGISIVAAVGNDEQGAIKPPANAPGVIAVGGADDNNRVGWDWSAYHSTYGRTADGLMKPELVAHAAWMAAPLLPETQEEKEAVTLYELVNTNDSALPDKLAALIQHIKIQYDPSGGMPVARIREVIINRIREAKYISPHYLHTDGTSFAAPVVSAVIAQLLEINALLNPAMVREILFATAKRRVDIPAERQGFGMIQARKAVLRVLKRAHFTAPPVSPHINNEARSIAFYMHHDSATQVSLAGSFNGWTPDTLLLQPGRNGLWKIEIPLLPPGRYQYKFFVDDAMWIEDVNNLYREPDGFMGFNSILIIEN